MINQMILSIIISPNQLWPARISDAGQPPTSAAILLSQESEGLPAYDLNGQCLFLTVQQSGLFTRRKTINNYIIYYPYKYQKILLILLKRYSKAPT